MLSKLRVGIATTVRLELPKPRFCFYGAFGSMPNDDLSRWISASLKAKALK
jgi:hypothetical protein